VTTSGQCHQQTIYVSAPHREGQRPNARISAALLRRSIHKDAQESKLFPQSLIDKKNNIFFLFYKLRSSFRCLGLSLFCLSSSWLKFGLIKAKCYCSLLQIIIAESN